MWWKIAVAGVVGLIVLALLTAAALFLLRAVARRVYERDRRS